METSELTGRLDLDRGAARAHPLAANADRVSCFLPRRARGIDRIRALEANIINIGHDRADRKCAIEPPDLAILERAVFKGVVAVLRLIDEERIANPALSETAAHEHAIEIIAHDWAFADRDLAATAIMQFLAPEPHKSILRAQTDRIAETDFEKRLMQVHVVAIGRADGKRLVHARSVFQS